jgi:hypothetical protein
MAFAVWWQMNTGGRCDGGLGWRPCPSYQQQTKDTLLLGKGERD